jgi:hypothetical protein
VCPGRETNLWNILVAKYYLSKYLNKLVNYVNNLINTTTGISYIHGVSDA